MVLLTIIEVCQFFDSATHTQSLVDRSLNVSGTNADYKITWMDPKGPTITHPAFPNAYTERYCNPIRTANYVGDPEPTRSTKNGETENCVTIVFLPQPNGRGTMCMADDFCSQRMGYVCEMSNDLVLDYFSE